MQARAFAAAAFAVTMALSGCSSDDSDISRVDSDLSRARSFERYPLYYLGDSFSGEQLTKVTAPFKILGRRTVTGYSFIYGDCEPGPDSGCSPPFELQNYSICNENPLAHSNAPGLVLEARGALYHGTDLYTGATTIRIFGVRPSEAARALRPVSGPSALGHDLPPPAFPRSMLRKLRFDHRFKDRRPLRQLIATLPHVRPTRC
jgi:hypothetical protein